VLLRYAHARDLPPAWDTLAGTCFRSRAFLTHTERHNPCGQRYHVLWDADRPVAGAIAYDLRIDLLTFAQVKSPLPMTVLGVPCSVAWPGLLGDRARWPAMLAELLPRERGLVLGLNTTAPITHPELVQGATLPTMVLEHGFDSFASYTTGLRSDYRRRLRRIRAALAEADRIETPCSALTEPGYRLYVGAYERSDAKLELLSHDFLARLPDPFHMVRYELSGHLLGWHISAVEPGRTTFFMGGVDQALNERHKTYFNLLFDVIELGIGAGSPTIDLGQTAEVPKLRTGARLQQRRMFAWHRRGLVRSGLRRAAPLLTYGETFEQPRVSKG
jgi:hypothetical protein